jgi:hypothetical protein
LLALLAAAVGAGGLLLLVRSPDPAAQAGLSAGGRDGAGSAGSGRSRPASWWQRLPRLLGGRAAPGDRSDTPGSDQQARAQDDTATAEAAPAGPGTSAGARLTPGGKQPAAEHWRGALSISGSVLGPDGKPVAGVLLQILPQQGPLNEAGRTDPLQQVGSRGDGSFSFVSLAEGEYELRNAAGGPYLPARASVRAGVTSALLVLRKRGDRTVQVTGVVVAPDRRPIAEVLVLPIGHKTRVQTDEQGRYQLDLVLEDATQNPTIRFMKQGYRDQRTAIAAARLTAGGPVRADVVLQPTQTEAPVTGIVKGRSGTPVAGATVQLLSPAGGRTLRTGSDLTGMFVFAKVETGANYRLWVRAREGYRDYLADQVTVPASGLDLAVELEPVALGSLSGSFVDPDGKPVPGFSLGLRSAQPGAAVRVTADPQGRFVVRDLPAGRVSLDSESAPLVSLSGIEIPAGGEVAVQLTVDWGGQQIAGLVLDANQRPVPAANIGLHWRQQKLGITSRSSRTTLTDQRGHFQFTDLGSGSHALSVSAPGFYPLTRDVAAAAPGAPELRLQLQEGGR